MVGEYMRVCVCVCVCVSIWGSEVSWEFTLFTAVEGRVVEKGAGSTPPLDTVIVLTLRHSLHTLTARFCGKERKTVS